MTVQYDGLHSITFYNKDLGGAKHSWRDFHLIPSSRPFIAMPEPKTAIITIPGTNKRIDITEHLAPTLLYEKRTGDWSFIIVHDLWKSWSEAFETIAQFIHGQSITVTLDDDKLYSYTGTLTISNYQPEKEYSTITIHYELDYEPSVLSDGYYPIKFILSNGQAYLNDYGITEGQLHYSNGILKLDDLTVIGRGEIPNKT